MEYILPPTEEPFGPSCGECELFSESQCLGVSTVRVTIGAAQKIKDAVVDGRSVDLSGMRQPAVYRSFRVLQQTLRYCPGPGNDGRGNFRKSEDRFSGYVSAAIIKTALAQTVARPTVGSPQKLRSSGYSFTPNKVVDSRDDPLDQKA